LDEEQHQQAAGEVDGKVRNRTVSEIIFRRIVPDTLLFMSLQSSVIGLVAGKAEVGSRSK